MLTPGGDYRFHIFQDAAAATGNGAELSITNASNGGMISLAFQVSGTFTATVTFEATVDGTNWIAVRAENLNDGTYATTATAAGLFRAVVHGLTRLRVRVSAYTSGNVTVKGNLVA